MLEMNIFIFKISQFMLKIKKNLVVKKYCHTVHNLTVLDFPKLILSAPLMCLQISHT